MGVKCDALQYESCYAVEEILPRESIKIDETPEHTVVCVDRLGRGMAGDIPKSFLFRNSTNSFVQHEFQLRAVGFQWNSSSLSNSFEKFAKELTVTLYRLFKRIALFWGTPCLPGCLQVIVMYAHHHSIRRFEDYVRSRFIETLDVNDLDTIFDT